MNRFFVDKINISSNQIFIEDKEDIKHINKVLSLRVGEKIEISDKYTFEYIAELVDIKNDLITCKIIEKCEFQNELPYNVDIFQGMPKGDKLEYIIQKSCELGINKIFPLETKRSISIKTEKVDKKLARYNKISKSAAEQSKRGIIPSVEYIVKFENMCEILKCYDLVIFAYEEEKELTLKDVLLRFKLKYDKDSLKNKKIAVIIGPEGGFDNSEVERIKELEIYPVTIGKTILRTETAGVVITSMINYELNL